MISEQSRIFDTLKSKKGAVDYDKLAGYYAQHRKIQPEVFKQLLKQGQIESRSRVLEVGCGTGNYISAIQDATGSLSPFIFRKLPQ